VNGEDKPATLGMPARRSRPEPPERTAAASSVREDGRAPSRTGFTFDAGGRRGYLNIQHSADDPGNDGSRRGQLRRAARDRRLQARTGVGRGASARGHAGAGRRDPAGASWRPPCSASQSGELSRAQQHLHSPFSSPASPPFFMRTCAPVSECTAIESPVVAHQQHLFSQPRRQGLGVERPPASRGSSWASTLRRRPRTRAWQCRPRAPSACQAAIELNPSALSAAPAARACSRPRR
jgi:hypothetical protein